MGNIRVMLGEWVILGQCWGNFKGKVFVVQCTMYKVSSNKMTKKEPAIESP